MRVLGIDPGSRVLGWGVVEAVGSRFRHLDSGVIRTKGEALPPRLVQIGDGLEAILVRYAPAVVAVERIFHAKNAMSALTLGHARGVALYLAARSGASVCEYTPTQIKQAVTGRGRADKTQVQSMICLLLGLPPGMPLDTSDALAAAICHLQWGSVPDDKRLVAGPSRRAG